MLQIGGDLPVETKPVRLALLSRGISSDDELFASLAAGLDFPAYFGRNWNALWDCLADLSWIPELTIVVVHERVPGLAPEKLTTYLEVLESAAAIQHRKANCELIAWFPEEDRELLEAALKRSESHEV